ncbi:MAG TPA: phosphatase PAP2 family protein [Gemmatimonadales bacterium]|nr:phosphatase PAP2 family protein [Gemmatimonadales bacterium]
MHQEPATRGRARRETAVVVALAAAFVLAQLTDHWIYVHCSYPAVYDRGWARLLRVVGYAPTWAIAALALTLRDWGTPSRASIGQAARRGLVLFMSVSISGLLAEALKLLFRRERPALTGGAHVFRAWSDQPFSSAQLGLPSSEGAVAFAAGAALARLFPEASVVWYGLAIGCGLTRVAAGAHFMSDVVLAGVVGYVTSAWIWRVSTKARSSPSTR